MADRTCPLLSMHHGLAHVSSASLKAGFSCSILGEEGMALGPTREFLKLLAADVLRPELAMFERTSADPSVCVPCTVHGSDGACGASMPNNTQRRELFWSLGRVIGAAVCREMNVALQLAPVVLEQVLGIEVRRYFPVRESCMIDRA